MVTVRLPRALAEEIAGIIDGHIEEYPVEHTWDVIEAVRQMDAERGTAMYRSHRYYVNGGTVYDRLDQVEIETEFADSDAARKWVNTHGKTGERDVCPACGHSGPYIEDKATCGAMLGVTVDVIKRCQCRCTGADQ
jgi:hypothetical protein